MPLKKDSMGRIHMIDEYTPSGSIIFDFHGDRVGVYQDAETQSSRDKFEAIDESAEFEREQLIPLLETIIEELKGDFGRDSE